MGLNSREHTSEKAFLATLALTIAWGFFLPSIDFAPEKLMNADMVWGELARTETIALLALLAAAYAVTVFYSARAPTAGLACMAGCGLGSIGFFLLFGKPTQFLSFGFIVSVSLFLASLKFNSFKEKSMDAASRASLYGLRLAVVGFSLVLLVQVLPMQPEYFRHGMTWVIDGVLASTEDQEKIINQAFEQLSAACPTRGKKYSESEVFSEVKDSEAFKGLDKISDTELRDAYKRIFVETTTLCLNQKIEANAVGALPPKEEVVKKVYEELLSKSPLVNRAKENFALLLALTVAFTLMPVAGFFMAPLAGMAYGALERLFK